MTMTSQDELTARIHAAKTALAALGECRPGRVTEQYNVCGTPGCRCKADPPQKHGPYYQLSYTRHGRGRTESVPAQDLAVVETQLQNYQQLRTLVDEWIDASIELDRLRRLRTPQTSPDNPAHDCIPKHQTAPHQPSENP